MRERQTFDEWNALEVFILGIWAVLGVGALAVLAVVLFSTFS